MAPPRRMSRRPDVPRCALLPDGRHRRERVPAAAAWPVLLLVDHRGTTVYPGVGLGPVAPVAAGAGATVGVPGVTGPRPTTRRTRSLSRLHSFPLRSNRGSVGVGGSGGGRRG
uniref:Uncharacterized protein n=1 Tax=Oryza meridionalis TaxID=40149 RepID=A0A0E0D883_9ORYZ